MYARQRKDRALDSFVQLASVRDSSQQTSLRNAVAFHSITPAHLSMQIIRSNSFLGSWTIDDKNRIRAFTHGTCVWNVFKMNFATEVSAKQSSKSRESLRKMRTKSSRWFCMQWTCFHAMSSISTDWDWSSERISHTIVLITVPFRKFKQEQDGNESPRHYTSCEPWKMSKQLKNLDQE